MLKKILQFIKGIEFSQIVIVVLFTWHVYITNRMLDIYLLKGSCPVELYVCQTTPTLAELYFVTRLKIDKRKYQTQIMQD